MADSSEIEQLEALITSEGYHRWREHIVREWGPAGERYQQAVRTAAAKDDATAMHHLKAVLFAQTEIEKLLLWPIERLREIRQAATVGMGGPSRRGTL